MGDKSMQIELRDYQTESINRVLAAYEANKHGRELLVLPTGAGKTLIFSQVIQLLNERHGLNAIVVAHRDELIQQAADKYRMVKPDAIIGKVGSGLHQYGGEVTVASIATISRPEHLKRLKAIGYGLIIVDEAHHVAANGYQAVLEALPDAFVLMVTATEDRLDGKKIIEKPALYSASIIDMVQKEYLCNLRAIAIKTHVNLDDLHTQAGDYKVDELEEAIDTDMRNKRVVDAYKEHADGRRAICFGVTVRHATNLAMAFKAGGVSAAIVSGETPLDERKKLYAGLHDGSIKVLTNVQVLTEGFDEPLISCIIMARPTQSRSLYVQSIGRGLRLAPAKQDCIILDLTDNCLKHRLEPQSLKKIIGKDIQDDESLLEAIEREEKEASEREARVRKLKDTRVKDIQVNLLEKLNWQQKDNGMFVLEVGKEKHRIAIVPSTTDGDEDMWGNPGYYSVWARLAPLYDAQEWLASAPLDWAQSFAERRARLLLTDANNIKLVDKNAAWRNYPASEKQIEMLTRFGIQFNPEITKGEASEILDPIFEKLKAKKTQKEKVG
jgi:superfamily II DNA or RNA helicase